MAEKQKTILCVLLDSSFSFAKDGARTRLVKGDEVELTETQLAAFKDLFEPVDAKDKAAKAASVEREVHKQEKKAKEEALATIARAKNKSERDNPSKTVDSIEETDTVEKEGDKDKDDEDKTDEDDTSETDESDTSEVSKQEGTDPTTEKPAPAKPLLGKLLGAKK